MDLETPLGRSEECRCRWLYTVLAIGIWSVWIIDFHRRPHFDWVGFVLGVFTLAGAVTTWWLYKSHPSATVNEEKS